MFDNCFSIYLDFFKHENELEIQRLTQRVLDLEDQVSETREREMEATRELQQEKLRSTHQRYQDQPSSGYGDTGGSVNVQSLEKSLKDLLSELKQTQTPLALESDTMDGLTSRLNAQAVNQRVLHHNSELTNFVSRLTEEKMELRNTLGRLEEEIWRYRQRGAEQQENRHLEARASWAKERLSLQLALNQMEQELDQYQADLRGERDRRMGVYPSPEDLQRGTRPRRSVTTFRSAARVVVAVTRSNGHDTSENHADQENRHLEARTSWAKERLSLQLALNQMEQELDQCRADFRVERDRRSDIAGVGTEGARDRDAVLGQEVEESHQSGIPRDGVQSTSNKVTQPTLTVSHHSASTPSHARTVLDPSTVTLHHPSIQVFISLDTVRPICLPALLRDLHNGASPYHSLGGASSGYHVNSNGVTNENSPYQSVGGISDSYHVNSNFSVHTTPPTRDYSSKPHPTSENSEKSSPGPLPPTQKLVTQLQHVEFSNVKVISKEIRGRSRDIVNTLLSS
uniref:Uncharacterized protein n=1 Tax=Magallana gigas TaxID=29159 RepID=A0A8W8M796_MAGGI